jgi:hypothetical protein
MWPGSGGFRIYKEKEHTMPTEVISPISCKGGKPGSIHRAESPGARARGDQSEQPHEPVRATIDLGGEDQPASVQVTGPQEE